MALSCTTDAATSPPAKRQVF